MGIILGHAKISNILRGVSGLPNIHIYASIHKYDDPSNDLGY